MGPLVDTVKQRPAQEEVLRIYKGLAKPFGRGPRPSDRTRAVPERARPIG